MLCELFVAILNACLLKHLSFFDNFGYEKLNAFFTNTNKKCSLSKSIFFVAHALHTIVVVSGEKRVRQLYSFLFFITFLFLSLFFSRQDKTRSLPLLLFDQPKYAISVTLLLFFDILFKQVVIFICLNLYIVRFIFSFSF